MNRRELLRGAGALAAAAHAPWPRVSSMLFGEPEPRPVLVTIFLRGGADWLNMVVPFEDSTYRAVRPTLALSEEDGLVPLDSHFALHPSLAPLAPLYHAKQLAPVLCVGSPHPTRSHFDAQDFMERAAPGLRNVTTGWLSRYLQATREEDSGGFRALAMQGLLPRSLRGDFPALAVPTNLDRRRGSKTLEEFEDLYGDGPGMGSGGEGAPVVESGRQTIDTLRRFMEIVEGAKERGSYPKSAFAERLRWIARVVQADCGLEVVAVDYPGWDHHVSQGSTAGSQARLLANISDSIAAFCKDLGPKLERTLILVMTEFGRTVAENGNNGTDHGRGAGVFLIGGGVRGGRIHGDWKGLERSDLIDGRDLPITTDFRDVMAASLEGLFDFDAPRDFFPGHKPGRLRLF